MKIDEDICVCLHVTKILILKKEWNVLKQGFFGFV